MATEHPDRRHLTFSQAEGLAELPAPLALKEISSEVRAVLWKVIHDSITGDMKRSSMTTGLGRTWEVILKDKHVFFDHLMIDEFSTNAKLAMASLKTVIAHGAYNELFDLIQFILRHPATSTTFASHIATALKMGRAAYTVVDEDTIVPLASEAEGTALIVALADLDGGPFKGARTHLKNAAQRLHDGSWADSVRESISAVEAVARVWAPSAKTLDPALRLLGGAHRLHPALLAGFGKLYGFTNDEKGLRHALLDEESAAVDEADAVYMLGACAAFTSYLVRRHREAK